MRGVIYGIGGATGSAGEVVDAVSAVIHKVAVADMETSAAIVLRSIEHGVRAGKNLPVTGGVLRRPILGLFPARKDKG